MSTKAWQVPLRLVTGLYFLNSGLSKRDVPEERAKALTDFAGPAFRPVQEAEPRQFVAVLSAAEVTIGSALVAVPFVPPLLAGLALLGFSGALNRLYIKTPWAHEPGSLRPTEQGTPLAKDFWLTAIGAALVIGSLTPGRKSR
jgi:hypothetical protein